MIDLVNIAKKRKVINQLDISTLRREIDFDFILKTVAAFSGVKSEEIVKKTNKREIVQARQIAHYFSVKLKIWSYAEIGREIGMKDHSTVIHSCKVINNLLSYNNEVSRMVGKIKEYLSVNG